MRKVLAAALGMALLVSVVAPAAQAAQFGVGLHYLRTFEDYGDDFSQNDFSVFGSVTIPVLLVRVEGQLEWTPDFLGSDEHLFQPAVYGLLPLGPIYGGVGIGWGYLTGDGAGWGTNPFYALRAGIEIGLAGFAVDAYLAYRFQQASFVDGAQNLDLDALTLAAQVKFGG